MPLETGTYISDLVTTNPAHSDPLSQADGHIRLIKATIKATFPNVNGAVASTDEDIDSTVNTVLTNGIPKLSDSGAFFKTNSTCGLTNPSATEVNIKAAGAIALRILNTGVVVPGTFTSTGNATFSGTLGVTGALTASGGATVTGAATVSGTITGGTVNSNGNMTAAGTITGAAVNSTGNASVAGTLSAGTLSAGTLSTGAVSASGAISANTVTANGVTSNGNASVAGALTANTVAAAGGLSGPGVIPVGGSMPWFSNSLPQDIWGAAAVGTWYWINGAEMPRSYPLFALLGTSYGAGNGSTTFNLPNISGRVLAAVDPGYGILTTATIPAGGNILGATGGAERHTLTADQMPSHTHTGNGTTSGHSNDHAHYTTISGTTSGQSADHTHNFTAGLYAGFNVQTGGGSNAMLNQTGTTTGASNDHTHTFSAAAWSGGANANHSHTYSFTTSGAGSGQAHNNVQPTFVCNYIIRLA